jgi:hypothetical protein
MGVHGGGSLLDNERKGRIVGTGWVGGLCHRHAVEDGGVCFSNTIYCNHGRIVR